MTALLPSRTALRAAFVTTVLVVAALGALI